MDRLNTSLFFHREGIRTTKRPLQNGRRSAGAEKSTFYSI